MDDPRGILRVATAEGLQLDIPVADLGERMAAALVDLLLLLAVLVALSAAMDALGLSWLIEAHLSAVVLIGYQPFFEQALGGRSPGKHLLGLRVVMTDGTRVRPAASMIRALAWLIEGWATLCLPALLCAVISRRSARVGDLAAGTAVVSSRRLAVRRPVPAVASRGGPGWA